MAVCISGCAFFFLPLRSYKCVCFLYPLLLVAGQETQKMHVKKNKIKYIYKNIKRQQEIRKYCKMGRKDAEVKSNISGKYMWGPRKHKTERMLTNKRAGWEGEDGKQTRRREGEMRRRLGGRKWKKEDRKDGQHRVTADNSHSLHSEQPIDRSKSTNTHRPTQRNLSERRSFAEKRSLDLMAAPKSSGLTLIQRGGRKKRLIALITKHNLHHATSSMNQRYKWAWSSLDDSRFF